MKGIEALQAMKEGKIVKDEYGKYYRMENYHVLCYVDGEWPSFEMHLNDWMDLNFEFTSKPVEYNLTFFEAMVEAAFWGDIVCSERYPNVKYYMKAGVLYHQDGITADLQSCEIKAKWRVVEEEEE